jgi:hypothetical protein
VGFFHSCISATEFVKAIVDFYLNTAIEKQYIAFKEGFESVCRGSAIKVSGHGVWQLELILNVQLFRPEELELLICGGSDLDFEALERVTQYDGDFDRSTPVIQ